MYRERRESRRTPSASIICISCPSIQTWNIARADTEGGREEGWRKDQLEDASTEIGRDGEGVDLLTVNEPQSVGLSRNESDGSSISNSGSLSEVGLRNEIGPVLSDVEERGFRNGFGSSGVESIQEPVKHRPVLLAVRK